MQKLLKLALHKAAARVQGPLAAQVRGSAPQSQPCDNAFWTAGAMSVCCTQILPPGVEELLLVCTCKFPPSEQGA